MQSNVPRKITIHEVALRDGIQSEKKLVSTKEKVTLINDLIGCGLRRIELSSFVNPRLVPQMADADELWGTIDRKKGIVYAALILSDKGLDRAIQCKVPHVGIYVSASETHSRKNSNMSVAEAVKEARRLISKARGAGMEVRAGVMNAFGCAYEGNVASGRVLTLVRNFMKREPDEICLADTSGMANPLQVKKTVKRVRDIVGFYEKGAGRNMPCRHVRHGESIAGEKDREACAGHCGCGADFTSPSQHARPGACQCMGSRY